MPVVQENILNCLAYFDLFSYPLTKEEIGRFISAKYDAQEIEAAINILLQTNNIYNINGFYSLENNLSLAVKRSRGNQLAAKKIKTAIRAGKILSCFPFVRAVAISGSLSKNFADQHSDMDFFIITAANRLWIARTLMHLFKKLTFLIGKQHSFCMNYYVDEAALEIEEKNIYTAIEIATLLPVSGGAYINQFFLANKWITSFLPNTGTTLKADAKTNSSFKTILEKLFPSLLAERLDIKLMKITSDRWRLKTLGNKINDRGILFTMCATRHQAKPEPLAFQEKLLKTYEENCRELQARHSALLRIAL
ncbi:MAG: hypothetical protein JWN76_1107 [Chitinophagaceae bacterium]|nr:hypothetical protein [Chitinophagaceae bacterium]